MSVKAVKKSKAPAKKKAAVKAAPARKPSPKKAPTKAGVGATVKAGVTKPIKITPKETVVGVAKPSLAKRTKAAKLAEPIVEPKRTKAAKLAEPIVEPKREVIDEAKPMPVLQQAAIQEHSMARSYVRSTGAGKGKLRGKTYQCTVSFTNDQMDRIVAAAQFRNVSLAEMIRSCVVEHLTPPAVIDDETI